MALSPSSSPPVEPTMVVPRRRLGLYAVVALLAATAAVVLGVLPAQFGVDPTGFGRLTGLDRLYQPQGPTETVVETTLSAPAEVATAPDTPFRTDTLTVEVGGMTQNYGQIEYKLSLAAGDDLVYEWRASGPLYFEFHGHTEPDENDEILVMDYIQGTSETGQGRLTAPLDGIHGWYFRNDGFEPVQVEFTFAGFYDLGPGVIIPGVEEPATATQADIDAAEDALLQAFPADGE